MFQDNSMIKEVNIVNKVICYLAVTISLMLCNQPLFMVFVSMFLLLITRPFSKLLKGNLILLIISILSIFIPQILWISKIGILIIYTILLTKVTKLIELRYILESSLYRFQSKQITYHILYIMYFGKYFTNNIKKMWLLKDDYGIRVSSKWIRFIIQKGYQKTKIQMQDFIDINKLRFYNDSKNRTYMNKPVWESWDTNYLLSHVIILFLTLFYGR